MIRRSFYIIINIKFFEKNAPTYKIYLKSYCLGECPLQRHIIYLLNYSIALFVSVSVLVTGCTKRSGSSTSETVTASIVIDASETGGTYKNVVGINKAPRGTDSQSFGSNTYNLAYLYQAMGISTVRSLDSSFDICSVYTDDSIINAADSSTLTGCTYSQGVHAVWSTNSGGANVNTSTSYSFTTVDNNLDAIYKSGASLLLRVGENDRGPNDTTDFTNFSIVAKNLYKHISGVSGGFGSAPAHNVSPTYIEIYNEPDSSFWMGSAANFYTLYNTTYDAIRAIAPASVKIGGSGFSNTFQTHTGISGNVAQNYVSNVTTSRLDFLSGHVYGSCDSATLSEMATKMNYFRSYMNSNSLSSKPLLITEWNIGLDCSTEDSFHSQRAQGFNGAILSMMQDSSLNIEKAMYYGGFGQMSFFTLDTANVGVVTIYPGAWAFKAHAQLIDGTLLDLQSCDSSNTCTTGVSTYVSPLQGTAVSISGQVRVVLSNDSASDANTTLQIKNWTGSSTPTLTVNSYPSVAVTVQAPNTVGVYTVSSSNASQLVSNNTTSTTAAATVSSGTLSSTLTVPKYSTLLLTVQ